MTILEKLYANRARIYDILMLHYDNEHLRGVYTEWLERVTEQIRRYYANHDMEGELI